MFLAPSSIGLPPALRGSTEASRPVRPVPPIRGLTFLINPERFLSPTWFASAPRQGSPRFVLAKLLKPGIAPQRIEHRVEPEQSRRNRRGGVRQCRYRQKFLQSSDGTI